MNKSISIVIGVLIVLGLVAGGLLLSSKQKPPAAKVAKDGVMTEDMQLEADRAALASSSSTPTQIYGAMIRLAQKQEKIAHDEALKQAKSENSLLRGGAAQALGYFDDEESMGALKTLLSDKEKSVRLFAVQGLGQKSAKLRESELEALLKSEDLDPEMKVEIQSSLLKAGSETAQASAKEALLSIAKEGEENVNTEAAQRLVTIIPEDTQVIDLMRRKISAAKNERLTAVGTRYLSARGDPWIRDVLKTLSHHPSPMVRAAVIQSLHRVCPKDRWELLNGFLEKEQDPSTMRLALEEPMFLLGQPAVTFLEKAVASKTLTSDQVKIAEESLKKVKASSGPELCDQQAASRANPKGDPVKESPVEATAPEGAAPAAAAAASAKPSAMAPKTAAPHAKH
jgi:HEAT repeat protein